MHGCCAGMGREKRAEPCSYRRMDARVVACKVKFPTPDFLTIFPTSKKRRTSGALQKTVKKLIRLALQALGCFSPARDRQEQACRSKKR